ncbi:hypothetical protein OHA40_21335 [Nocardia sp. NBC_00508]|uniref:hypothetical protein n=1 Tax=Nocardia sp. NBC_00508 TaxID=2975992 RepID=UPI002E81403D|nr:hypothetical protein [Nocardia sp. NBC_00508]WUD64245.1 hypothetical protein OHA40_21335 [Nocardia sp. NBC_00508]
MTTTVDGHAAVATSAARLAIGRALAPVILVLLVLDALLTLSLEVLYLPTYLGTIAFPVAAVLAGVVNVLLVAGARSVTQRTAAVGLPLAAWAFGFLICASLGPGGDVLLGSDARTALLLFCGLLPPLAYIYFQMNVRAFRPR